SIVYSITGGADAAKFSINGSSGALVFVVAPDFETPADADANNSYEVTIRASDGTSNDEQTITVTVTNENDNTPVITSNGGAATATVSLLNPQQLVTTVSASDADGNLDPLVYTISGGDDAADFTMTNGVLAFNFATDVNNPQDANLDNHYIVKVKVSDGVFTDEQTITVIVTGTMPVTLVKFKGYAKPLGNRLEWETADEVSMQFYVVQRSLDGNNFVDIGQVTAKSGAVNTYEFYDKDPKPVGFYRLKMVNNDGSFTLSAIVKISAVYAGGGLQIYPNPASGSVISLKMADVFNGACRVDWCNVTGQILHTQQFIKQPGSSGTTLPVPANLIAGTYYLVVTGPGFRVTEKLIVR
ncbi:MAG TPA: T9SS type A sorting domain-containing protein, partial [Chitinophagaceae bacterium]